MRAHVAQDGDEVDGGSIVAVEHKGPWLALLITARAVAVVTLLRAQIPLTNKEVVPKQRGHSCDVYASSIKMTRN